MRDKWGASFKRAMAPVAASGGLYALLFGGAGAFTPFLGVWLKANGFAPAQIGLLIAAPLLARTLLAPLVGAWARGFKNLRAPLAVLCCASAAGCFALL
jgi:PPP family 3-phenylpropionic acid transporter